MAFTYAHLKRFAEAKPLLERSLAAKTRIKVADKAEITGTLERLVGVCLNTGDRELADHHLERCIKATRRTRN